MKNVAAFVFGAVVAAALGLLGLSKHDMLVATYSAMSLVFCVILIYESRTVTVDPRISLISTATLVVASLLFLYVLNYDNGAIVNKRWYAHIEGMTAWTIAYPLAYLATECIVLLFGARLNRFLMSGFMVFNSEALTSLMLISVSIFSKSHLDKSFMFVDELSYLFMGVVLSLIAAVITCRLLRGKGYIMSRETLEKGETTSEERRHMVVMASDDEDDRKRIRLDDRQDRIVSAAFLVIELAIFAVMFWTVAAGIAPGLEHGHPAPYLESTCVACAILLAVIPVLRLIGAVKMPWWFNILLTLDVYIYSISLCLGMYLDDSIPWWGFFGHVLSTMSVGAVVFLSLCIIETKTSDRITMGSEAGFHCFTLMISLAFGGIWEVMEGYVDICVGQAYMSYGVFDSLDDLRADLVGSVLMVFLAYFILRRQTVREVADSTVIRNPFRHRGEA